MRHGIDPASVSALIDTLGWRAHVRYAIDPAKCECPNKYPGLQAHMRHAIDQRSVSV